MYANLAQLGLILSSLLALIVPLGYFWLKPISIARYRKFLTNIILIQFISTSFAFVCLGYAYLVSDFSLYNVFRNSHVAMPLIYKFSGIWSNHEGSMLLWLFILGLVNYVSSLHRLKNSEMIWITSTQIIITSSLILYTILKSNPFVKLIPTPMQGAGFNPLLQDVGLAIHPPILYIGYITTIVGFSISIAALIRKNLSPDLLSLMQKWCLFSWSFLTLGVALGSWWAYRELGWGGYWFWDPVENASLLPWLTSSALIHSIYVTKKLNTNYRWTILLAIFTFLLSILATFLVRSGVITSVHSFASDPNRGVFILSLLLCYTSFALGLFAINGHYFETNTSNKWLSRFGGINLANIFWSLATLVILLSLLFPVIMEIYNDQQVSIDRSFFEKSFIPLLMPILLLLSLTLPASWQKILPIHYLHLAYSLIPAIILSGCFYYYSVTSPSLISSAAFFCGALVVSRMCFWFVQKMENPLSYKFYLIWLVHLCVGLFAMSIAFTESNSQETFVNMRIGDEVKFAGFEIKYLNQKNLAIDNYLVGSIILNLAKNDQKIATLTPEIRYYPVEKSQTSEVSIYHNYFYDLYVVISEICKDGKVGIKIYFKPLISWLWVICLTIFTCGILLFILNVRKSNASN